MKEGFIRARKQSITKEAILQAAFEMTRAEGLTNVTARRLADHAGCSTQPIFRVYSAMDELYGEIYEMAISYFSDYYANFKGVDQTPFVNLGLAYIQFAEKEPQLFQLLFMGEKRNGHSLIELLNGNGALVKEIGKAGAKGSDIFMKMWMFIHGAACMVITGDYDLTQEQTKQLLLESYRAYAG